MSRSVGIWGEAQVANYLRKNSSLRKKYEEFMRDADGKSLESAFQKKFENMDYINGKIQDMISWSGGCTPPRGENKGLLSFWRE